jgi:hypothetical protein
MVIIKHTALEAKAQKRAHGMAIQAASQHQTDLFIQLAHHQKPINNLINNLFFFTLFTRILVIVFLHQLLFFHIQQLGNRT